MEPTVTAAFVPSHVRASRFAPESVAVATAGALVASLGAAGLYPQMDDGKLRWFVGAAAGTLAMLIVRKAARARTSFHAAVHALVLSAVLGTVLAWTCGMVIFGGRDVEGAFALALFAVPFGGIPGAVYGLPLVVIAATARAGRLAGAADAFARARRSAGLTIALASLPGLFPALHGTEGILYGLLLGTVVLGALLAGEAQIEILRRGAWVRRVRRGDEPFVVVRPRRPGDTVDDLPRLTGEAEILELAPDVGAYRANAARMPLALV